MNLVRLQYGGGSSIEPYIVNVTCSPSMVGKTVTMTQGSTVLSKICPSSLEVTFKPMNDGLWTVECEGSTKDVTLLAWGAYNVSIYWGLSGWLKTIGKTTTETNLLVYLNDVNNQADIRELMTRHVSADYLYDWYVTIPSVLDDVMASTYGAKWLGLRDYVCDKFMANETAKATMLNSDNWEYILKDKVPVMTSNTAPYGEVIHSNVGSYTGNNWDDNLSYYIFTNDKVIGAYVENVNFEIGYKFINPILVGRIEITVWARGKDYAGKIMAYINNAWVELCELTFSNGIEDKKEIKLDIIPTAYATEIKFVSTIPKTPSTGIDLKNFQIYGRTLNVSVPTMTSNTEPYGEVKTSAIQGSYYGYKAFNSVVSSSDIWATSDAKGHLGYKFPNKVNIRAVYTKGTNDNWTVKAYKLRYSDDGGVTWNYATPNILNGSTTGNLNIIDTNEYHECWDIEVVSGGNSYASLEVLNFYGVDYSERDFAEDSKVEYIYDHGVKLKTIETSISNGGTIDEQSDQILWSTNNKNGVTMLGAKVDVTDKKVARARFGLQAYTNASDENMGFMILNNALAWNTPFNAVKAADMPNNANVNFASGGYSGDYYVIFGADFTDVFNVYNTLQELWVE